MAKSCFIISEIGEESSEPRKFADEKFELVFKPILKELGYDVKRADKIGSPGSISREIVQNLIDSDLVIADVSTNNPNVFYELAIRNAVKKPVIIFRSPNQIMPFDIYDKRAIPIDRTEPMIWENAKQQLKGQVQIAEQNSELASRSILSDFLFNVNTNHQRTDLDRIYSILEDIRQEVRFSKKPKTFGQLQVPQKWLQEIGHPISQPLPKQNVIKIPLNSSKPGCEKTNECFIPPTLKIKKDDSVTWINQDTAGHTVTSGNLAKDPDNTGTLFDSSIFLSGKTYSYKFEEIGEYPYFCMLHPWQTGIIIVE